MAALRRYVIAGLLVWVPLVITGFIIKFMFDIVYGLVQALPAAMRPETFFGVTLPGAGLGIAFLLLLTVLAVTGMVVTNLFGRQLLRLGETVLERIPFVRGVYGAVKQVTETLFSNSGKSFRKVVLIEYPHANSWTLAFLTGEGTREINRKTGKDLLNVFVPTTPNPTSGFFLMLPRERVIELDMNVDEGLKMLLSVGVVTPGEKKLPNGSVRQPN